jgi:acyl-CoA synthetase (AMP-forming)/AMP-acid ligase II
VERAVIGIPDSRWDERPLACVVAGANVDPGELEAFLTERVARWQVPENLAFVHDTEDVRRQVRQEGGAHAVRERRPGTDPDLTL